MTAAAPTVPPTIAPTLVDFELELLDDVDEALGTMSEEFCS